MRAGEIESGSLFFSLFLVFVVFQVSKCQQLESPLFHKSISPSLHSFCLLSSSSLLSLHFTLFRPCQTWACVPLPVCLNITLSGNRTRKTRVDSQQSGLPLVQTHFISFHFIFFVRSSACSSSSRAGTTLTHKHTSPRLLTTNKHQPTEGHPCID